MSWKIFVQGRGQQDLVLIETAADGTVGELLKKAEAAGIQVEPHSVVLVEDTEDPLEDDLSLSAAGITDRASVYVGQCRRAAVTVRYAGEEKTEEFSPSQRLRHVFKWAVGKKGFNIPPEDAQDLILVQAGEDQSVNSDDQIASILEAQQCSARLDLVPSDRIQG